MKQVFFAVVSLISVSAYALELKPLKQEEDKHSLAERASSVHYVKVFSAGKRKYKIVEMDSPLTGAASTNTILLVSEEGMDVGGEAGHEAAFVITPSEKIGAFYGSIGIEKGDVLVFRLYDFERKPVTRRFRYDGKNRVLKEVK